MHSIWAFASFSLHSAFGVFFFVLYFLILHSKKKISILHMPLLDMRYKTFNVFTLHQIKYCSYSHQLQPFPCVGEKQKNINIGNKSTRRRKKNKKQILSFDRYIETDFVRLKTRKSQIQRWIMIIIKTQTKQWCVIWKWWIVHSSSTNNNNKKTFATDKMQWDE